MQKQLSTYRMLLALAWALILGIFTCTDNLDALLYHQVVHFQWIAKPNFADLLITSDAHVTDPYWLLIKSGHFVGFGLLEALLFYWRRKRKWSAIVAVLFAIATEILQLYVGRDGRLTDMGIDSAGVLLSYYAQKRRLRAGRD